MYCRQVQSHLDDYISNQIDDKLIDKIDDHLKNCPDCQKQLDTNKFLISALQSNKTPDPGDYYWQQMEQSILARTINNKQTEDETFFPDKTKSEPISIMQRYLLPLAASFVLLFGSLIFSDLILNQPQSGLIMTNSKKISNHSESQIFATIIAASPGSLGRNLIFANIASLNGITGGTK